MYNWLKSIILATQQQFKIVVSDNLQISSELGMSDLHAIPITNITHSFCRDKVELGVSAKELTRITLGNNHAAYTHVCLQGIGCVYKIGILRGYAIRSGRRPEGSQRPQGGPQVRLGRWLPEGRLPDRIA